jgi:hypothetical protein
MCLGRFGWPALGIDLTILDTVLGRGAGDKCLGASRQIDGTIERETAQRLIQ